MATIPPEILIILTNQYHLKKMKQLNQIEFSQKTKEIIENCDYSRSDIAKKLEISASNISQITAEKQFHETKLNGIRSKVLNLLGYEIKVVPVHFIVDKLSK